MKHILRYINHKTFNENYYKGEKDYSTNNKNHKALFLNDLDYTLNWVLKQNPEFETNDESARIKTIEDWHEFNNRISRDENIKNFINRKTYIFKNDVINYMKIYQKAKKQGYLTAYRQIGLDKLSDFNKNNIGYYWSFDSVLLNSYLSEFGKDTLRILITADIKFENINWENGLDNYIYYGEYESEIKILNDNNIKIVNIELIHYKHYVNGVEQFNISHSKNGYRIYRLRNIKYEKEANDIMRKLLDDISSAIKESINENTTFIYNHIKKTNPHHGARDAFQGIPSLKGYNWNIEPTLIYPNDEKIDKEMLYPASKMDVKRYMKAFQKGSEFPPIVLFDDGKKYHIFDGAHRLQAAINLNIPIKAYIGYIKK